MSSEIGEDFTRGHIFHLFRKLCFLETGVEEKPDSRHITFEDDHLGNVIAVLDTAALPVPTEHGGENAMIDITKSMSQKLAILADKIDSIDQYKAPLLFGLGQGRQPQFEIVLEDPGEEYRIGGCLPKLVVQIPVNEVSVKRLQEAVSESFLDQVRKEANKLFLRVDHMKEGIPGPVVERVLRAEEAWMKAMKSPANPAPK